jgi:hypothetical protein
LPYLATPCRATPSRALPGLFLFHDCFRPYVRP